MSYNDSYNKPGSGFGLSIGSRWTRSIMILIIINISVFVVQLMFSTISSQWGGISPGTDIDGIIPQFALGPDQFTSIFWLYQPFAIGKLWLWQFVTYMFLHSVSSPWHIIFNMLVLWMFGSQVERAMGTKKFLIMYFTAGIFAGIFCCLFTPDSPIIGASGAIFAVEVAFAMFYPNSTIIFIMFPIKAKYLVMIFAGITVISCIMPASGNTAHFAHLGGLIYGFLFIRYEPRFSSFLLSWQNQQQTKECQKEEDIKRQVDVLLDKVNQGGMKSLTRRERNFLRSASKRYRKTRS